jgi:16S rRNA processing protein RimM
MNETGRGALERDKELIAIGCVRRPFGLKGHFFLEAFGKALSALKTPRRVFQGKSEQQTTAAMLSEIRKSPRGFIGKFEGHDTCEAAEILRGVYLFLEKNELPQLRGNEYYSFELQGMSVVAVPSLKTIGIVVEIQSFPTVDALNVRKEDGSMVLISMNKGIIEKIDREKQCIVVSESALEQII